MNKSLDYVYKMFAYLDNTYINKLKYTQMRQGTQALHGIWKNTPTARESARRQQNAAKHGFDVRMAGVRRKVDKIFAIVAIFVKTATIFLRSISNLRIADFGEKSQKDNIV